MKTLSQNFQTIGSYPPAHHTPHHADLEKHYLGKTKWQIEQALRQQNYEIIQFMHWLYVVDLGLVLSFSHQVCVQVGKYEGV